MAILCPVTSEDRTMCPLWGFLKVDTKQAYQKGWEKGYMFASHEAREEQIEAIQRKINRLLDKGLKLTEEEERELIEYFMGLIA